MGRRRGLGVARGRALEPGCGAGVFIGLAPEGMEMVGVELDGTTATIAQELYPDARIINRSFAENSRRLTAGSFDLTIGNVPFGKVSLYDPKYNRAGHSIHNHFIVKSLALTRPGGLAVLLSSRYTLDAANPAARREISSLADLIGAVRLPSGAHRRVAGTQAVTDLLVLRRRPESAQPADDSWVRTELVDVDGHDLRLNSYLAQHPEQVLGELKLARGLYENDELVVDGDPSAAAVAARIRAWGARVAETVAGTRPVGPRAEDLLQRETGGVDGGVLFAEPEPELVEAPEGLWDGHLVPLPSGEFAVVQDGLQVPFATPRTIRAELRALLRAARPRETTAARGGGELHGHAGDRHRASAAPRRLSGVRAPVGADQPLHRTAHRPDRPGDRRGADRTRSCRRRSGRCAATRSRRSCIGLEVFDEETGQAQPAALLRERVVAPRAPVLGADTPQDALAVCLDSRGRVELETIAQLLGDTPEGARAQLGELVYDTPDGQLLPAAEYLSGNVREKLDAARLAAVDRARSWR